MDELPRVNNILDEMRQNGCDGMGCVLSARGTEDGWEYFHETGGYKDSVEVQGPVPLKKVPGELFALIKNRHESIITERKKEDLRGGGWEPVGTDSPQWREFKKIPGLAAMKEGETISITRVNGSEWFFKSE